ncbi:MAG: tetratricopeptide repeat protein [Pseudomonadota bacterium]
MKLLTLIIIIFYELSCATGSKPKMESVDPAAKKEAAENAASASSEGEILSSSGSKKYGSTMVTSLSNSGFTSRRVNREAAAALAGAEAKSLTELQTSFYAQRLTSGGLEQVISKAKAMVAEELKKGVENDLSETFKLELALAAVQAKNAGFARLYLNQLSSSKNPKIRAGVFNAQGVMALTAGDIPDAAALFKESLKASSNYPAALFNLGFISLKYGDFEGARTNLEPLGDDWYAQSGVLVAVRNLGDDARAEGICSRLLAKHSNNKTILFNCGLFFLQNKGDKVKAKDLVTKAVKLEGGPARWDDDAYKILEKLGG